MLTKAAIYWAYSSRKITIYDQATLNSVAAREGRYYSALTFLFKIGLYINASVIIFQMVTLLRIENFTHTIIN